MHRRQFIKQSGMTGIAAMASGLFDQQTIAMNTYSARTIARVIRHQGYPQLFINDEPHIHLIYSFCEPVQDFIRNFSKNIGIHIYNWGKGNIIYGCMDLGWIGPEKYDYSKFDREVSEILEADPQALLLPRLAVSAPDWWLENHPDDRLLLEDGSYAKPDFRGKKYETSLASETWLKDVSVALEKFIEHARSQVYGKHIIGYQLTGGSNEWFYYGSGYVGDGIPDFSPAAISRFRKWLRSRYKNDIQSLRKSWNSNVTDFEMITVPSGAERLKTDVNLLRDPAVSRRVIDYFEFHSEVVADAIIHLCQVGKRITGNESIFGVFYGYIINATGAYTGGFARVHWGHQALLKVLNCPEVDFLASPYQYTHRGAGGYDGPQSIEASVALHGKLFLVEVDTPTFNAKPDGWYQGIPGIPIHDESIGILKRDFSHRMIVRGQGMWWTELSCSEGWYQHPEITELLRKTRKIFENSLKLDTQYKGEVAVFLDEESAFYVKPGIEMSYPQIFLQDRLGLARMGTTYDYYLHNDIGRDDFPDYKLYIFLDSIYLTSWEKEYINRKLKQKNKVVLWLNMTGLIDEHGIRDTNMQELTGINLKYHVVSRYIREFLANRIYLTNFDHPITRNLPVNFFFGTEAQIAPIVYADDQDAITLGRLMPVHGLSGTLGQHPGFVLKRFTEWTSIYISAPNIPSDLLRNIAAFAGCHIYNHDNEILYANSHYLMIHVSKTGNKQFILPQDCNVYNAFTDELVAKDVKGFTEAIRQYDTKLYYLNKT